MSEKVDVILFLRCKLSVFHFLASLCVWERGRERGGKREDLQISLSTRILRSFELGGIPKVFFALYLLSVFIVFLVFLVSWSFLLFFGARMMLIWSRSVWWGFEWCVGDDCGQCGVLGLDGLGFLGEWGFLQVVLENGVWAGMDFMLN